jgi:hypothetical protein
MRSWSVSRGAAACLLWALAASQARATGAEPARDLQVDPSPCVAAAASHEDDKSIEDASGREFDGQRDAIELTRNRSDQLKVVPAWQEVGVQCFCPGNQELHGAACEDIVLSISALSRDLKRGNAIDILAIDSKHLAAGRQNRCIWTESHEGVRQSRSPFNEMLAIIQHEQEFSRSDFPPNGFEGNPVGALSKVENSPNRKGHQSRI